MTETYKIETCLQSFLLFNLRIVYRWQELSYCLHDITLKLFNLRIGYRWQELSYCLHDITLKFIAYRNFKLITRHLAQGNKLFLM